MKAKFYNLKDSATAMSMIAKSQWGPFLETFGHLHHGWLAKIETKDTVTKEQVTSHECPLESIGA